MKLAKIVLSAALVVSCLNSSSFAQMVGGDVFLQGNYIEVGIAKRGNYGSDSAAPTSYHANGIASTPCGGRSGLLLGLMADPDRDGWSTGSPAFYGDYFLPGSPWEDWQIQSGSLRGSAYVCSSSPLTGSNTGYVATATNVSGIWDGLFDSLRIHKVTTLDTGALYFTTTVTITNISSVAKNNIYYVRTLDPDNDQRQAGGTFTTVNKIEYQLPNRFNATLVSATAPNHRQAYYAMGSVDSSATCMYYASWPLSLSCPLDSVYNHTSRCLGSAAYNMSDSLRSDIAIAIAFKIAHLASADSATDSIGVYKMHPANSRTFTYFSSFAPEASDSAIARLGRDYLLDTTTKLAVQDINYAKEIKLYPNPGNGTVNITGLDLADEVVCYDMTGKLSGEAMHASREGVNTFYFPSLATGLHIVVVKDAVGNVKMRIPYRKI